MSQDKIERCLDGIHRLELTMTRMEHDLARNTDDMEEHIRRTNLLEKKMTKIYAVMLIGVGVALATAGPQFLALVKVFL